MDLNKEIKFPSINFHDIKLAKLYKNKYIVSGIMLTTTLIMFGYIFVAPSSMKKTNQTSLSYNQNNKQSPFGSSAKSSMQGQDTSPTIINPTAAPSPTPIPNLTPIPTFTPTPTLVPTLIVDPLATWRIYQNMQYGYIIRYPSDWTMQDKGELEPKIPSYIVFNQNTASSAARSITVSASTRTYQEQIAIDGAGTPVNVANANGIKQYFQDSNGLQSTAIVIPRANYLIILRSKTAYLGTFNSMLETLHLTKL